VVHALLDSPSAAAAFRFTIHPGERTVFDTELALYPRAEIATVGIAPLTSMFLFDASERTRIDDYRTAVHDSNGLLLRTGKGEQIWRPLANPRELQISAFTDRGRRGFGLMQRSRALGDYQDLEARYENRLSLWVEPARDWGEGVVELVEIPTDREVNDNVVAFWRPHEPLKAKGEYIFNYRLHWCWSAPSEPPLSEVIATRSGLAWHSSAWRSLRHAPRGAQSWLEGAWTGPGVCSECSAFAARLMSWVSRTLNTNPAHKSAPVRQRSTLVFARSDIVDEPLREGVVASPKITDA
jgi:glucan biosynthesis protein